MRIRPLLSCLVPALLLAAVPVAAQTQTGNAASIVAPQPSREAVMGALNGGAAGLTALHRYLDSGIPPEDLIGRVDQLLNALRDRMDMYDTATLVAAIDRVVDQARASLTPEARNAPLTPDEQLEVEAEIQALAAALLAEIATAAGPEGLPNNLPEPVFQSELTASPS